MIIRIDYTEPEVMLDVWGGTTGTFDGIDRFNRITDQRWLNYSSGSTDLDRYKYGYDRNSNRQWKENTVSNHAALPKTALSAGLRLSDLGPVQYLTCYIHR